MPLAKGVQIERNLLGDQVYDYLREAVLDGDLGQGERVVEARIARQLSVSRAPVREAINRLLGDGLLEAHTHVGTTVVRMTPGKIRHLYELRAAIEGLAIRKVVARRERLDLAPLHACVDEMGRMARAGDLRRLVEAEVAFHRILCELSGNPYVVAMNETLAAQMRLALVIDNARYAEMAEVAQEHVPLLEVILAGDPDRAAQMIHAHIMSSLDRLPAPGPGADA